MIYPSIIDSAGLFRNWRAGKLDENDAGAAYRQYIYPNGYLLTKFELHELFNVQKHDEAKLEFGIEKTMSAILSAVPSASTMLKSAEAENGDGEDYDFAQPCPPVCDERSVYNPS